MPTHVTVYRRPDTFAGWPANHGAWQWNNEFLCGFMTGPYTRKMRTHQVDPPFSKLQARSLDGGDTWTTETPGVDFDAAWTSPVRIRTGGKSDIGYPQLFRRTDGDLVCVYYWAAGVGDQQRIESTRFTP